MKILYLRYSLLGIFFVSICFTACIPENIELPCRLISVMTYDSVSNVTESEATISGKVCTAGLDSITCGFIYGTSYPNSFYTYGVENKSTYSSSGFSVNISALSANTTYYYRAFAVDAGQYQLGEVYSFKTSFSVTTDDATDIRYNEATLNGIVNTSEQSIACGFVYGTSPTLSFTDDTKVSTYSSGSFSVKIRKLVPDTTYYYQAYAVIDNERKYGDVYSFRTSKEVTVTTKDAVDVTLSKATVKGVLNHSEHPLTCGFVYGQSSSLSSYNTTVSTTSKDNFSIQLSGLSADRTYYYRAFVVVDGMKKYGDIQSFDTKRLPSVTTEDAIYITLHEATIEFSLSRYDYQSQMKGVIYSTSSNLSSTTGMTQVDTTENSGNCSVSLIGLNPNTTYYYCAYVYSMMDNQYIYGDVLSFTTDSEFTVTTGEVIDLGLSVKWAACNIGAQSPEEYGGYYAWGEIEEKNVYDWTTYKWCNGSYDTPTKYNSWSDWGYVDDKYVLDSDDDVAQTLLGDDWRMPTEEEVEELLDNCEIEWTSLNGVNGLKVIGPNGNSIFLPAAGFRYGTSFSSGVYYWTSSGNGIGRWACSFFEYFDNHWIDLDINSDRYLGFSIRPIQK